MRYIKQTLWHILWEIVVKRYGIYLTKLMGILDKIMGYIMGYNWQNFEIMGYIKQQLIQKLWDIFPDAMGIFGKTIGYNGKNGYI